MNGIKKLIAYIVCVGVLNPAKHIDNEAALGTLV